MNSPRAFDFGTLLSLCVVAAGVTAAQPSHSAAGSQEGPKQPTVLFMCPHGAAKSVLASAYFERLAEERGLNLRVLSAGTEPDREVAPAVASHLSKNGYRIPVTEPKQVTADDMASADVVISIGCDLSGLPQPRGRLLKWDDAAALSDDFATADARIREKVTALIDELVRTRHR